MLDLHCLHSSVTNLIIVLYGGNYSTLLFIFIKHNILIEVFMVKMDSYTVKLDDETAKFLTLHLVQNVENPDEIRKKVINGELQCCILKAGLIVDPFQIVVAANKAVVNEKFGKLTTRTIFTEILFNLSLSKNITQSLTKFGIDDKEKNIIIAIIHKANDAEILTKNILAAVKGEKTSISKLKNITDLTAVKKTYKIEEPELKISDIVDSIASRMNTKDFASY